MKAEQFAQLPFYKSGVIVDWAEKSRSLLADTPVEVTITGEQVHGGAKLFVDGVRVARKIQSHDGPVKPGVYPGTISRHLGGGGPGPLGADLHIHIGAGPLRPYVPPALPPIPTGQHTTVGIPPIPYADGWNGGESFSRSICSGNYQFGAVVDGDVRPLLADIGGKECLVIEALSPTYVETYSTSRGRKKWDFQVGQMWTVGEGGVADNFREVAVETGGTVDNLGRW